MTEQELEWELENLLGDGWNYCYSVEHWLRDGLWKDRLYTIFAKKKTNTLEKELVILSHEFPSWRAAFDDFKVKLRKIK